MIWCFHRKKDKACNIWLQYYQLTIRLDSQGGFLLSLQAE